MATSPFSLTLLLLRHGKASDLSNNDHERPLTEKGIHQAHKKGNIIKHNFPLIETVLCSTAIRTTETLQHLNLNIPSQNIFMRDELYLAEEDVLLTQIQQIEQPGCILMIGHNPGLHQLAYSLLSPIHEKHLIEIAELSISFPTCALSCIKFPHQTWQDIRFGNGILSDYYPH